MFSIHQHHHSHQVIPLSLLIMIIFITVIIIFFSTSSSSSFVNAHLFSSSSQKKETSSGDNKNNKQQLLQQQRSIKNWRWCVSNIEKFYVPKTNFTRVHKKQPTPMMWTAEGNRLCGFKMISMTTLQQEAFFSNDDDPSLISRHTFIGDSTSLRAYATAVNDFFPSNAIVDVGKVSQAPPWLATQVGEEKFPEPHSSSSNLKTKKRKTELRFVKMIHLAHWLESMQRAFGSKSDAVIKDTNTNNNNKEGNASPPSSSSSADTNSEDKPARNDHHAVIRESESFINAIPSFLNKGLISFSLGNWDLNWKLQPTYKIPGFGRKTLANAMRYWSSNSQQLFNWLDVNVLIPLSSNSGKSKGKKNNNKNNNNQILKKGSPPLILIKEQLTPQCDASRFEPKRIGKKKFPKKCEELLKPIVIPMYRRVLATLAWSRNIPVVPVDFLVNKLGPGVCRMGDGIHLDAGCMPHEQQLLWNVYLLMRRNGVKQRPLFKRDSSYKKGGTIVRDRIDSENNEETDEEIKQNFGSPNHQLQLNATEALNDALFAKWYCSKPWRTENAAICSSGDDSSSRSNKVKDNNNKDESGSENKDITTTDGNAVVIPRPPSSSPPQLTSSNANNNHNNDNNNDVEEEGITVATDDLRKLVSQERENNKQKQKNGDRSDSFEYDIRRQNGLATTDVFTVVLIVLVPIVAYFGLRAAAK